MRQKPLNLQFIIIIIITTATATITTAAAAATTAAAAAATDVYMLLGQDAFCGWDVYILQLSVK
jgi:hypothetical protein